MQTSLTYRTNRDLFSNYYLNEHLPETEEGMKSRMISFKRRDLRSF